MLRIILNFILIHLFIFSTISLLGQSPFPNTVFYQIYTRAFYDSDGDGLGDLNGITHKLDYIEDLGVGALWIMPLFKSNTPHKYFTTDFMQVDPEYGTNEDLQYLVKEAHKRGIKVLIDFSINHVNRDNSWFLKSMNGKESKVYEKYFHWVDDMGDYNPETYTKEGVFDSTYTKNYKLVDQSIMTSKHYYARFLDAPDLNYDHPDVRAYFLNVGKYWLSEIGIDGLRLDAARHIYDIESTMVMDSTKRNYTWWKTFCDEMYKVKPNAFLLGEIWTNKEIKASYLKTGMHAVFNFSFSEAMLRCVKKENNFGLTIEYLEQMQLYHKARNKFGDATFLINHDTKRLVNELNFNKQKVKLAVALLMTLPGSPFIYYGEELAYEADRPLLWLPMLWDEYGKDSGQTSWILSDKTIMNGILTVALDRKEISHFKPLSIQKKEKNSTYHYYRKLIRLRKASDALSNGKLIKSEFSNEKIVSFIRITKNQSVLVIHNLTPGNLQLKTPVKYHNFNKVLFLNNGAKKNNKTIYIPPYSSIILEEIK